MDDFDYELPADRIAVRPCEPRDASRLLVCGREIATVGETVKMAGEGGWQLQDTLFMQVPALLPPNAMLILNDSRVIAARLPGRKEPTGGKAEVMLLSPLAPSRDPAVALNAMSGEAVWECFVGGRKVKEGDVILCDPRVEEEEEGATKGGEEGGREEGGEGLRAEVLSKNGPDATVKMTWGGNTPLGEVLAAFGRVPLPPYIKRAADKKDLQTYQTAHAANDGSVAAPTAGLHLSERLMAQVRAAGTEVLTVTLHVGAGTFKPMDAAEAKAHSMHAERIGVQAEEIQRLLEGIAADKVLVPVGTTTVRTLESLYWWGVKLIAEDVTPDAPELKVDQWDPYRLRASLGGVAGLPSAKEALEAVLAWARAREGGGAVGYTSLMIVPGYQFALCDLLFTNTHQPRSTLMMLVSALVGGQERLMQVYGYALQNGYRFLSYGDGNLLQCHPASSFPKRR